MPLTKKGEKIERNMKREYGPKKGERYFYASKNAGTITGVDAERITGTLPARYRQRPGEELRTSRSVPIREQIAQRQREERARQAVAARKPFDIVGYLKPGAKMGRDVMRRGGGFDPTADARSHDMLNRAIAAGREENEAQTQARRLLEGASVSGRDRGRLRRR